MIDEEITYAEKGYYSTDLKPKSGKPVYAVCEGESCQREGGMGRWVKKCDYRDLCMLCARKKKRKYSYDGFEDIVRSIDEDKTYAEKGYRSTDLSVQSHKEVWAVCTECGHGRWLAFGSYSDMCYKCAMKNLPIEKCETPTEKRECIDDDITYAEKGYRSTDLKPESHKEVWRVCLGCGEGIWVMFQSCTDLCFLCSCKTDERREKIRENRGDTSGENNPNWKGGITSERKKFYNSQEHEYWRIDVFERDDYTCQECLERGVVLNAHHILPYRDYRDAEYSLNIDNGITLCEKCHNKTKSKEYEFVERYQEIIISKKL